MKDLAIDVCERLETLTRYSFDFLIDALLSFADEGASAGESIARTLVDFVACALENDL